MFNTISKEEIDATLLI